ncbi:DoxX family protein [Streptomyces chiangmaiensis]|uniref:DoxX family protein n=1 Tax=Streptomyces chiangmaiensis TaxID=766497 RepID=UPI003CD08BCE
MCTGALTPLAATIAAGVMTVAVTVKRHNGLWVQNDGYEYPLVLIILPAVLTLTGPGRWSIDQALGLNPWHPAWTAAAVLVGVGSALLTRRILGSPSGR